MKRPTRKFECTKCGDEFLAARSDAKSCKKCHYERVKTHQKSPRGRALRAKNHRTMREKAFDGYGNKCACCGEGKFEFLSIDHVNGGGNQDRRKHSTWQIAKRVVVGRFPKEYRLLCHNCNLSLGFFGYCPHQKTA